jgi:hypothetical protein
VCFLARIYVLVLLVGGFHGVAGCGLGNCPRAWSKIGNLFTEAARIPTPANKHNHQKHLSSPLHQRKPQRPHNHHHHAISLLQPVAAASPPRLPRPDPRRLHPESPTPLEPLVARLLAPCVVANPRKGAARRPTHAGYNIPFARRRGV